MNKICKNIFFCAILCFCLTGCSPKIQDHSAPITKTYKYFEIPDVILVHNKGKDKKITNKDSLYNEILDLTNQRFSNKIDYYELAIEMNKLKNFEKNEIVLEFIYKDSKQTKYDENGTFSRKYKKLIMPLTGKYTNCVFFDTGDNSSYGPIATLSSPDSLIKILK